MNTDRLSIRALQVSDADFIFELVNTEGWLKFIGNRNVSSTIEAVAYINKILANSNISYWVIELKSDHTPIGIVTFIKRDYLDHPDIGFAFLPAFTGKGYALEATNAVLQQLAAEKKLTRILATTIPENTSSVNLLKKMGLQFQKEIEVNQQILHIYSRRF